MILYPLHNKNVVAGPFVRWDASTQEFIKEIAFTRHLDMHKATLLSLNVLVLMK